MITQERLKELLHYDPNTGVFTWRIALGSRSAGSAAGCVWKGKCNKYIHVRIDRKLYYGQILAWLYMTGGYPPDEVDHKDGDGLNNRWKNLRPASRFENMRNTRKRSNNTSGFKGVSYVKKHDRWTADIGHFGKRHHLGYFGSPEEAHAAYRVAAIRLHGEYARLS